MLFTEINAAAKRVHPRRLIDYKCKLPGSSVYCQGSDPGSNLDKLLESGGNQGEIPVSGLSGESGSTCVVNGPKTWDATGGPGPGDARVGWRTRIEGLVA